MTELQRLIPSLNTRVAACGGKELSAIITNVICMVLTKKTKEKKEEYENGEISKEDVESFTTTLMADLTVKLVSGELFDDVSQELARAIQCGERGIDFCG